MVDSISVNDSFETMFYKLIDQVDFSPIERSDVVVKYEEFCDSFEETHNELQRDLRWHEDKVDVIDDLCNSAIREIRSSKENLSKEDLVQLFKEILEA